MKTQLRYLVLNIRSGVDQKQGQRKKLEELVQLSDTSLRMLGVEQPDTLTSLKTSLTPRTSLTATCQGEQIFGQSFILTIPFIVALFVPSMCFGASQPEVVQRIRSLGCALGGGIHKGIIQLQEAQTVKRLVLVIQPRIDTRRKTLSATR